MKKVIKINNVEYEMAASAYTQFAYKNLTGRGFISDIQKLTNINVEDYLSVDGLIETLLDIAYVMNKEAEPDRFINEELFIKSIDVLFENPKWIVDVITLATTPISGNLQKGE